MNTNVTRMSNSSSSTGNILDLLLINFDWSHAEDFAVFNSTRFWVGSVISPLRYVYTTKEIYGAS